MFKETNWEDELEKHEDTIKEIKEMDFDYEAHDNNFSWLLDTNKNYLEQLIAFKKYDAGTLGEDEKCKKKSE